MEKYLDFFTHKTVVWTALLLAIFLAALLFVLLVRRKRRKRRRQRVKPAFEIMRGTYEGAVVPLIGEEEIIIGRDSKVSHFVIIEGKISRKHCAIRFDKRNNSYLVTDFSTNGTYVNRDIGLEYGVPTAVNRGSVLWLGDNENVLRLC